jgi:hypothetical protein
MGLSAGILLFITEVSMIHTNSKQYFETSYHIHLSVILCPPSRNHLINERRIFERNKTAITDMANLPEFYVPNIRHGI